MTRCLWCGARNYTIDFWCVRCSHYLDWAPPGRRYHRGLAFLSALAAIAGVSLFLALPAAAWFSGPRPTLSFTLPKIALTADAPSLQDGWTRNQDAAASPTATPVPEATATADAMPTPDSTPAPDSTAAPDSSLPQSAPPLQAGLPPVGATNPALTPGTNPGVVDPANAVTRFYQAISAHRFDVAASLWTAQLQAQQPPTTFIDQRYAATDRVDVVIQRVVSAGDGIATVYVDVVEVVGGLNRRWVGSWQVVRTASGWLLNQSDLRIQA